MSFSTYSLMQAYMQVGHSDSYMFCHSVFVGFDRVLL